MEIEKSSGVFVDSRLNLNQGFTLPELLIYVALFSIVAGLMVNIALITLQISNRESSSAEVVEQFNFVVQTISRLVRQSSNIDMPVGVPTSTLTLRMSDPTQDPTIVYLNGSSLSIQVGGNSPSMLTSSQVIVNSLSFQKSSQYPGHDSVSVDITMSSNTSSSQAQIQRTLSLAAARISPAAFNDNLNIGTTPGYIGTSTLSWKNLFLSNYLSVGALASSPTTSIQGAIYFNSGSNTFKGYDGTKWNDFISYWQNNGANIYNINSGNVGIGTVSPDEKLSVVGGAIRTNYSYKDAFAWETNSRYASNLALAYNMGGFGGGAVSPGTNFYDPSRWSAYDARSLQSLGFEGAVFDGRYIYFVPNRTISATNNDRQDGIVLRYDTTQSFNLPSSWLVYDAGNTFGFDSTGFYGGVFDGRYIYFVPMTNNSGYDGIVLRYDTTQSFTSSGSWAAYDASNTGGLNSTGFKGGLFDGRYVYFVGTNYTILRYDTTVPLPSGGSWAAFDVRPVVGNTPYSGAVFDGRYIYFVSSAGGTIQLRYDTTQPFTSNSSWSSYDASSTDGLYAAGYFGAVFDGRYVYYVPNFDNVKLDNYTGVVLRYDTAQSFSSSSAWSAYDAGNTGGLTTKGFQGAVFDGRYIYFVPNQNSNLSINPDGYVLRYDTNQSFFSSNSWSVYDASNSGGLSNTIGYAGGIFDGRYIYFAPWHSSVCNVSATCANGKVLRFDTGSPYPEQSMVQTARTPEFFLNSQNNIGIGTTNPTLPLQVSGGDMAIANSGNGLILKTPNGSACARVSIDNSGNMVTSTVSCP